ncbi:branched-chain amino acid transport system II carrier protein [Brevibacillus ginsengisoli]|uniref:branched-chain amino acid transport system II carrier protein n=1 Tax=Brevibacillus ginsengisoli TaxID=363854 RepID=UPI003CEF0E87
MNALSKKDLLFVSFMLFSMFFGAGNLIFPTFLGYQAGDELWPSLAGFILSDVGLSILAVAAIAKLGSFRTLAARVSPQFAFIFPVLVYLSIGPGLAIPRAGSLAYEMSFGSLLPHELAVHPVSLLAYTLVFFGVVFWLSMSPSKLVDRFGKLLTPLLLIMILAVFIRSLFVSNAGVGAAQGAYAIHPISKGFLDGYQTMDALAALAYGIVVANAIRSKGVENTQKLSGYIIGAGIGAGILLSVIYLILGTLGVTSAAVNPANGAPILSEVMSRLFGQGGTVLLGALFTLACLCVSIGLVTSCSQFFSSVIPALSYQTWVRIICFLSLIIANLGLAQILKVSVPILGALYPVATVLILLGLADKLFNSSRRVYGITITFVAIFSVVDMINVTFLKGAWTAWLGHLPFYPQGFGWLLPALMGVIAGGIAARLGPTEENRRNQLAD